MKKFNEEADVLAYISLAIGILSVFIYFISILIPITAVVFGIISLSRKKSKIALIGLIIGCVYTFQYLNVNYILPKLKNSDSNSDIAVVTYKKSKVQKKAESKGFYCTGSKCTNIGYTPTNIPMDYVIDLDEEYIDNSYEMDMGDGEIANVQTRYGYNTKVAVSAMYLRKSGILYDYRYNDITKERTCNYDDLSNCMFNMSNVKELIQYFNDMME